MLDGSRSTDLARRARLAFADQLADAGPRLLQAVVEAARVLLDKPAERAVSHQRRDNVQALMTRGADWVRRQAEVLRDAADLADKADSMSGRLVASLQGNAPLKLVDDETVQREIFVSRLTQSIVDEAVWELNDLGSRIASLEGLPEMQGGDLFRPQQLAKTCIRAFLDAGLGPEVWAGMENTLRYEIALLATEAYHDANHFLIERGVMPEVNLRQLIRRSVDSRATLVASQPLRLGEWQGGAGGAQGATTIGPTSDFTRTTTFGQETGAGGTGAGLVGGSGSGGAAQADQTMQRLGRAVERHVRGFADPRQHVPPSRALTGAFAGAQSDLAARMEARRAEGGSFAPGEMVDVLRAQKQELKQAAETPAERATIEVVALLFQSILTEDRIPASVRVWFARLQMPTLRVAVSEPDFFSSAQHPARRLIDRMGACVMGFEPGQDAGAPLEAEVARVVQIVEAFPETGRKVFQTVLVEFERFLERYFRDQNETTRKGVSLAQQVEQRETLAVQYTIELRKLLDGVPVQDGVRDFLFQVWADVLATTAVRHGAQSAETKAIRDAALELVWIAGAKTTREERAEVIRRLGPLLASLRRGMIAGGLPAERQETSLRALNMSLTAAFAARSAAIVPEQLGRLKLRLEALDEILPDADFEIDDSFALDLSAHESDELEVVAEGGLEPTAAALAATDDLQVGAWYLLEYRDRREPVQLAWQGMRRQLSLFVSARGRCVLFQKRRLAAFLQARLLSSVQDESLTVAATRSAIDKINADPDRLR